MDVPDCLMGVPDCSPECSRDLMGVPEFGCRSSLVDGCPGITSASRSSMGVPEFVLRSDGCPGVRPEFVLPEFGCLGITSLQDFGDLMGPPAPGYGVDKSRWST